MHLIWTSAFALLIATGGMLGLMLPFGKLASEAGVPPLLWALLISTGAGGVLLAVSLLRGARFHLDAHRLRYFIITAAVSYAAPNLLTFTIMPHVGAGYAGIMYTLSPVFTLLMSILLRIRPPNGLGVAGIAIGFVGAVMVTATRGEADQPAALVWVMLGLLVPASLAVGNIYRSYDWPRNAGPIELAVGSHLAAAAMLFVALVATGQAGAVGMLADVPFLALAQAAASTGMYVFFFRLQQVGGPVYLSQIGYLAAAVGLLSGTLVLGEHYALLTWLGAGVICIGVAVTTKAQSQPSESRAGSGGAGDASTAAGKRERERL
jgi:drug/metabolite transporter (DMT)-like permease